LIYIVFAQKIISGAVEFALPFHMIDRIN